MEQESTKMEVTDSSASNPNTDDNKESSVKPSQEMPPPSLAFKKPMLVGPRPGLKKVQKKNILEDEEKVKVTPDAPSEKESEKSNTKSKTELLDSKPSKPVSKQSAPTPGATYKEPSWSGLATESYSFEVLKSGVIADTVNLTSKPYHIFGRLPSCDITLEHPSLSRYHAVLQYCAVANEKHEVGWYIYDLDSTHGTWANKAKLNPNTYYRLRVGHVVKFGGSSRLYILQGPDEDQETESEYSITEMKQMRDKQEKELEVLRHADSEMKTSKGKAVAQEDTGCSWGMDEDAVEVESENPFAELPVENEELYIDDPKKALRGYFEREGLDLPEYEVQENGFGKYKCTVELPIDTPTGQPIVAEAVISGKKKDAVAQCALEACRILDRHGVLRQAKHESRKKKKKNWEDDDFYDSDDDSFLDRTGIIEKKRKNRMKRAGKLEEKVQTYESLCHKMDEIKREIEEHEIQLEKAKAAACRSDDIDDIDAYVNSIKSGEAMDSKTRMKIKRQIFELKQEQQKVQKLLNIAKPANLPPPKPLAKPKEEESLKLKQGAIVGKKLHMPITKPVSRPALPVAPSTATDDVEEEEDEEEEIEAESKVEKIDASDRISPVAMEKESEAPKSLPKKSLPKKEDMENKNTPVPKGNDDNPVEKPPTKRKSSDKPIENSKEKQVKVSKEYCESDPDYALWLPPTDQAGDGTTSLNAKFGY